MTLENDNKELVRRLYECGWGRGDLSVIDQAFSAEHVLHWNDGDASLQQRTAGEVKAIVEAYRQAFPDLCITIDNLVAEGDKVAAQVTFSGTHRQAYEGFQPTHRRSRFTDMQILRIENGKIVESFLGSGGLKFFFSILDGTFFQGKGEQAPENRIE